MLRWVSGNSFEPSCYDYAASELWLLQEYTVRRYVLRIIGTVAR